jgi:hypothetical protein
MKILKSTVYSYLNDNSRHYRRWGLILTIPGISLLLVGIFAYQTIIFYLIIIGIVLFGLGINYLRKSRNYGSGMEGEKAVSQMLQSLDDSNYLIDDFLMDSRNSNIDHILLSPKGLFVIETKNYTGQIVCYGDKWIRKSNRRSYEIPSITMQAKKNAQEISGLIYKKNNLRIFVTPLCVFTNPNVEIRLNSPSIEC